MPSPKETKPKTKATKAGAAQAKEHAQAMADAAEAADQELAQHDERMRELVMKSHEARRAADEAYQLAHADEIAEAEARAKENRGHHHRIRDGHRAHLAGRRNLASHPYRAAPDDHHKKITTVKIDGKVHAVISAHELFLGSKGLEDTDKPRAGSRYRMACGLTVDTPHDELYHERFDEAPHDCPGCKDALEAMAEGRTPDLRSEYLSSKEQLAHERAQNRKRNTERSRRVSGRSR